MKHGNPHEFPFHLGIYDIVPFFAKCRIGLTIGKRIASSETIKSRDFNGAEKVRRRRVEGLSFRSSYSRVLVQVSRGRGSRAIINYSR